MIGSPGTLSMPRETHQISLVLPPHIIGPSAGLQLVFCRPIILILLLLDNPQHVSSIPDDFEDSFKSWLGSIMQPLSRPHNTTDITMVEGTTSKDTPRKRPWGLRWRSSLGFVTFGACFSPYIVSRLKTKPGYVSDSYNAWCVSTSRDIRTRTYPTSQTGILTDLLVYSLIIPVIPYQLKALGYDGIGAKISWLLVAFVRLFLSLDFSLLNNLF